MITLTLLLASLALASAEQISPGHEQFKAGMRALAAEQYDKAETAFRAAVAADPLHDGAFYGLGQVYMATKRYPNAVKAYEDSRAAFLAAIAAEKYDAAKMDRRIRDQLQVLKEYERELQRMPASTSGLSNALDRNRENMRQLESRLNKSDAGGTPPVPAGLSMALGSAYYRSQNIEAAEKSYLEAIKVEPGFGEAHNNLAVIYMITGRLDLADREIGLAEQSGFKVNPKLKEDLKSRRK